MKKFVFSVSGMSCAMCENHINDVVRRMRDIDSVKSSRKKNETVVIADTLDTEVIKKHYRFLDMKRNSKKKKSSFLFHSYRLLVLLL